MKSITSIVAALIVFAVFATATRVHLESVPQTILPHKWISNGPASPDAVIPMTIAVSQRNLDQIESVFWEVSNPRHEKYGKHLSFEEVTKMTAPSAATLTRISEWLLAHGAKHIDISPSLDFIHTRMTVANAEAMLAVSFQHFTHAKNGKTCIRTQDRYTVPTELASEIDFVGHISRFPSEKPMARDSNEADTQSFAAQTAVANAANDNSPLVISVRPGDGTLTTIVVPRCNDGSFTAEPTSPCSDVAGNNTVTVTVTAEPLGSAPVSTVYPSMFDCRACSNWAKYTGFCEGLVKNQPGFSMSSVLCQVNVVGVPNFVPIHTKAVGTFAQGQVSPARYFADNTNNPLPMIASTWTTPFSLKQLYKVPQGTRGINAKNSQSVAEFLGQYYSDADLAQFYRLLGVIPPVMPVVTIGPNDQSNPGGEASLDIQYLLGIAVNISTVFWSVAENGPYNDTFNQPQEGFLKWITDVSADANPPLVHSVSYSDVETSLAREYTDRLNVEFIKLGARGVSLLFASGDDGAGSEYARENNTYCEPFNPGFPSGSPYVTCVGGTQLSRTNLPVAGDGTWLVDTAEMMCDSYFGGVITSGGGYSYYYPAPDYQSDFVNSYNEKEAARLPPARDFNKLGRAYPDVSGISHNYLVIIAGQMSAIHGTSASTPAVASLFSLLNDVRLNMGLAPLGFLNPFLYQLASDRPGVYNDITVGNNKCTTNFFDCCPYGFEAARGWDPVTGLGSINYAVLLEAMLDLSGKIDQQAQINSFVFPASIASLVGNFVAIVGVIVVIILIRRRGSSGEMQHLINSA